jgi:hypothetical protein
MHAAVRWRVPRSFGVEPDKAMDTRAGIEEVAGSTWSAKTPGGRIGWPLNQVDRVPSTTEIPVQIAALP